MSDLTISERKTPLKILVVLTCFFSFSSALFWFWAEVRRHKATNELAEAARRGDADAMLRVPEWPALHWFIASVVLLFFAIVVGAITFLYWTIARRELRKSDQQNR